jgi:ABC-type glycerol-3-phosphate transport system permease component
MERVCVRPFSGQQKGKDPTDWGTMAAASAFLMVPALIVVFAMQKAMARGLIEGAVKG